MGNLTFAWVGRGQLDWGCQVSVDFPFSGAFFGVYRKRQNIFVNDWLTKKDLQKL